MRLAVVLLLVLGWLAPAQAAEPTKPLPPGRVEVVVEDLHCATCAKKVARKLYALKGVRKVAYSLPNDLVVATLPANQPVPAAAIWAAVQAGGTPPVELRYADKRLDAEAMKPLLAARSRATTTR